MTPDPPGMAAVDPTNPQSWNRYAYVMNNPINLIDLVGLECYAWDNGQSTNWGSPDGSNPALLGEFGDIFSVYESVWVPHGTTSTIEDGNFYFETGNGHYEFVLVGDISYIVGENNIVAANNGPDPVAVANSMKQYVKAQISNCYNGFHQTLFGKGVQAFSALALFPVASNYQDNRTALGAEVLGKLSVAAGSNGAGAVFTPVLESFTGNVTTPLYVLGTGLDTGAYLLCAASGATSIHP